MVLKKESEVSGTGEIIEYAAKVPVLINYSIGTKRYFKVPDEDDLRKIESAKATEWIPTDELPKGYNTEQPKHSHWYVLGKFLLYKKDSNVTGSCICSI